MLGAVGHTGSAAIPAPGSVVLAAFVLVVVGLVLCALYERRMTSPVLRLSVYAMAVGLILLVAAGVLIGVRWGH